MRTILLIHLLFVLNIANAEKRIGISGEITACRLETAISKIEEHYKNGEKEFVLDLDSHGGDLGAAIAFIERLDQYADAKITTQLSGSWSQCSSACFPIFAAGDRRVAYSGSEFFVHGLSWHKSKSTGPSPMVGDSDEDLSAETRDNIVSMFFNNIFRAINVCSLGENRYWLAGAKPNFELAIDEYLAAVRRSSLQIADDISPYIKGSANRKKTYEAKDLRRIDPEFLTSK